MDRPGFWGEPWWIDAPASGLRVEADGDTLTLVRIGRSRRYAVPGVAWGNWHLTDLPRSGRVVLHGGRNQPLLLVDTDLRLTRPAGDWRLGANPDVLALPATGEALITASKALYWLRDTRLSGAGICGDTTPPPPQPMTLTDPPGAEVLAPHPGPGGYLPIRGGRPSFSPPGSASSSSAPTAPSAASRPSHRSASTPRTATPAPATSSSTPATTPSSSTARAP